MNVFFVLFLNTRNCMYQFVLKVYLSQNENLINLINRNNYS